MEKKALNVAQLLRMGRNFTLRGKLDRFNKLMDMRAQAAASRRYDRSMAYIDADNYYNQAQKYLLDSDVNPFLGKRHTAWKRIVSDPISIPDPFGRITAVSDTSDALGGLMATPIKSRNHSLNKNPLYDSNQLATFNMALKRLDPELHKKVLTTGSF